MYFERFSTSEAASELNICIDSLRKIIKNVPGFPSISVGNRHVIPIEAFYDFFDNNLNCKRVEQLFSSRAEIDFQKIRQNGIEWRKARNARKVK